MYLHHVSIFVWMLLLYNSYQLHATSDVLVLFSKGQISLKQLLQIMENTSSSIEIIKDSVPAVRVGNTTVKLFDLHSSNSNQDTSFAIQVLIQNVYEKDCCINDTTIVGPSCSASAYAVAQLIRRSGVSVRHLHTAPLPAPLAAEVRGTSEGVLPPADFLADASVALVKYSNWSKVMAIYEHTNVDMSLILNRFRDLLHTGNSRLVAVFPWIPNLRRTLHSYAVRIFFLFLSPCLATEALCKAFRLGITSPKFQWVVVKTTLKEMLTCDLSRCKTDDILKSSENAIFINFEPYHKDARLHLTLTQQAYQRILWGLFDNLENLNINEFSERIYIKQAQDMGKTASLIYSLGSKSLRNTSETRLFFIPSEPITVFEVMNFPLGISLMVWNFFFFAMFAVLLIATVVHRKHNALRISSPPLLYLSYIGMFLVNIPLMIYLVQKTIPIVSDSVYVNLCWLYLFANNIGSTLVLGTIAIKLWRLYRIFIHFTNPGRLLSNHKLVLLVCCLPSLDFIICSFWFILDPIYRLYIKVSSNNLQATRTYFAVCRSKASPFLKPLLTGYKIVILIVIIILIYKLRKNIPKAHNRLKSAALTVGWYLTLFIIFVWTPAYAVIHLVLMNVTVEAVLVALIFFTLQGIFSTIMFLPPLVSVWKSRCVNKHSKFCNSS